MVKIVVFVLAGCLIGAALGYFGKCTSGTCPFTANPFRGAGFGALFGLLFALSSSGSLFGGNRHSKPESLAIIRVADSATLDTLIGTSAVPVLVDFYADWCGPCRKLAPELSAVADAWKDRAAIVKINVDQHRDIAARFNVQSIPDIRIFSAGTERKRLTGYRSSEQLSALLLEAGGKE